MKRCATSLAIRETQIKTTMKHHFTPTRMVIIKKEWQMLESMWRNWKPHSMQLECKIVQPCWKIICQFLTLLNIVLLTIWSSQLTLRYIPKYSSIDEHINKMERIFTIQRYSAVKRNYLSATMWKDLETITLNERKHMYGSIYIKCPNYVNL